MNAVIYARSSCVVPNARSIDQVALCRAYCEREGWTVVGIFTDQPNGGEAELGCHARPGLVAILSAVDCGGIHRVVVGTTDRIARHQSDASAIRERVRLAGARLVVAGSDAPAIHVVILALFDGAFHRDWFARTKRSRKAASGYPHGTSVA